MGQSEEKAQIDPALSRLACRSNMGIVALCPCCRCSPDSIVALSAPYAPFGTLASNRRVYRIGTMTRVSIVAKPRLALISLCLRL